MSKSICIAYHSEKQIVTKTHPSHSGLVFAVAKICKIIGIWQVETENFCRINARRIE